MRVNPFVIATTTGDRFTLRRRLTRSIADVRVRQVPVLHLRAAARLLRAEFADAPVVVGTTLLLCAAIVWVVAQNIVEHARASERGALLIAGAAMALLIAVHRMRTDRRLLERVGIAPAALFIAEYLLVLLPLAMLLGFSGRPAAALLTLLAAPVVAVLPSNGRVARPRMLRRRVRLPLPTQAFEWIGAARRLWLLLGVAGALLLIGTSFAPSSSWPALGILAVLAYIGCDAYLSPPSEGWILAHVFMDRPHGFLCRKLALGVGTYFILAAVPLLVLLAVHPTRERAATSLLGALVGAAALTGALLTKYCAYRPGQRAAPVMIVASMGAWLGSMAIAPALVPLLAIVLWRGAVRRVTPFLPASGNADRGTPIT